MVTDVHAEPLQGSITTAALFALADAAKQVLVELAPGWMAWVTFGGVLVVVEVVDVVEVEVEVLEKVGVPVEQGIDPPQALPGSGVPSQVHDD